MFRINKSIINSLKRLQGTILKPQYLSLNHLVPEIPQSQDTNHASTSSYPVAQNRWSRDQHIELVNINSDPGKGMITRIIATKLTAASASECLFADFFSEIEPKKVSEALKHPGWVYAMQEELNQSNRNKGRRNSDYNETLHQWPRMEAIRRFLAFCFHTLELHSSKWMPDIYYLMSHVASYQASQKEITYHWCEKNLQRKLVCWSAKKQQSVAMSSVDVEYVAAGKFWCTAIAYDPSPPEDDSEEHPLKEYKIKFRVMNGKKPLTLDFKTFVEATGLDYNQGTYVSHSSPKAVKAELARIFCNDGSLPQRRKGIDQKDHPSTTETTPTEKVPTEDSDKTQSGTRKSQPLPKGKMTDPKDLGGNKHPVDMGLPAMVPDKSIGKTKPLPEGPHENKELERLKPFADIESLNPSYALSRT
ncbi:hypothetical protein Tco_0937641 [Tanacetum coccineum]|uniref:Uncharacterized protein n=1 Tax=Tanacetum coccineum TaxID=301880 RepID=A0ABQ5DEU2_9ASTR